MGFFVTMQRVTGKRPDWRGDARVGHPQERVASVGVLAAYRERLATKLDGRASFGKMLYFPRQRLCGKLSRVRRNAIIARRLKGLTPRLPVFSADRASP